METIVNEFVLSTRSKRDNKNRHDTFSSLNDEKLQVMVDETKEFNDGLYCDLKSINFNEIYCAHFVNRLRKRRRIWLKKTSLCETQGIKIRQKFCVFSKSSNVEQMESISSKRIHLLGKENGFDIPVDCMFHLISLDRILTHLTQLRTYFSRFWKEYMKRVFLVKYLAKVEMEYQEVSACIN